MSKKSCEWVVAESGREAPNVALLGRDDAVRSQLRSALTELGANLVFEGQLRGADPSEVSAAQPSVVLLNLDAGGEDALDHIEDLLLDPSMRVIFNEAETTAKLSGWDLARWARHLAAKVMGHGRTIPPPPDGAEYLPDSEVLLEPGAPPSPESQALPLSMDTLADEANSRLDKVPASNGPSRSDEHAPAAEHIEVAETAEDLSIDSDAIASAMHAVEAAPAEVVRRADNTRAADDAADQVDAAIGVDHAELDAALAAIDAGEAEVAEPGQSIDPDSDGAFADFDADSVATAVAGDTLEAELEALAMGTDEGVDEDATTLGGANDAFDLSDDGAAPLSFSSEAEELSGELDADVAALAAQIDAMEDRMPKGEMEVQELDFSSEFDDEDEVPAARPTGAPRATPEADLSLTDELGEMQVASAPRPYTPPPEINISHLSLEALPDPGLLVEKVKARAAPDEPYLPRPGIDLELAPLHGNDEAAPAKPEKRHSAVEADIGGGFDLKGLSLEPIGDEAEAPTQAAAQSGIRRVLVLGASIGGPDALRTFLAGLPANFPALLVLAQHLESGFFDRLGQQLQKVSKLPVRVASASAPARLGEVLIIPSGQRFRIDAEGRISSEPYDGPTHYKPCIDDVMRDVADAFGSRATAVIFSGMAGDAVEGAVYITSKGGEVWAQKPESCVVSSMVDGAQARGVVEFLGSPRELAEHCIARYGRGAP